MNHLVALRDVIESWDAGAWGHAAPDPSTGTHVLRSTNFRAGATISFSNEAVLDIDASVAERKRLFAGDVLLERSGGGPLQPVGRVAYFEVPADAPSDRRYICGNFISRLVPNRAKVDPKYLVLQLLSWHANGVTTQFQTATTGIRNLQLREYLNWPLVLPSLCAQRRITARLKAQLAAVEAARKAAQAQVADAEALRQALYREAFASIGNFPSVPLGEVADLQLGKMLSPKARSGDHTAFPYLRNQNVQWDRFDLAELASMEFSVRERQKFELRAGDLLVCEGGEPGRCAVWDGRLSRCYYQKALHRIRVRPDVAVPEFLSLWIRHQAFAGAFADQNAKTTIAHLPLVRLERLKIPRLSVAAQRHIAAGLKRRLATAAQIDSAARARLTDLEALPARLLAQAFDPVRPELVEG